MEKKITIMGEEIKISFNLACQIKYELIAEKTFDTQAFHTIRDSVMLYYAIIQTFNPDTKIDIIQLMEKITHEELQLLASAVAECMQDWFHIPETAKLDAPSEDTEAENAKNA